MSTSNSDAAQSPHGVGRAWTITLGEGPIVAAAVHDGHEVRPEVADLLAIDAAVRRREEDGLSAAWTLLAGTRVVVHRSRFEVDMNRAPDQAVYRTPEQAFGLKVWWSEPPLDIVSRSLELHRAFYDEMRWVLRRMTERYGAFIVLDLHSYNHRRGGRDAEPADPLHNPEINIGTASMSQQRWGAIVERFASELRAAEFPLHPLDVRQNVRFLGGYFPRWIHTTFPESGCAIAVEVKKFFMDEWTGVVDQRLVVALRRALGRAAAAALEELAKPRAKSKPAPWTSRS
jgi:N-formylglutamate amidohydrolase